MNPLALGDPRWDELRHAYGSAGDVPDMLRALADGELDAWERIWSALCHQGDVYTASFAALPHVVAIGATRPIAAQTMFWLFAGAVVAESSTGPDRVPSDLRGPLDAAIADAEPRAIACLGAQRGGKDREDIWLAVSIAGLRRQAAIARVVESLVDEEHTLRCPGCDVFLHVYLTSLPFAVQPADGQPVSTVTHVEPHVPRVALEELARTVDQAGHAALAARLRQLDGQVTCPACGATFPLF